MEDIINKIYGRLNNLDSILVQSSRTNSEKYNSISNECFLNKKLILEKVDLFDFKEQYEKMQQYLLK